MRLGFYLGAGFHEAACTAAEPLPWQLSVWFTNRLKGLKLVYKIFVFKIIN